MQQELGHRGSHGERGAHDGRGGRGRGPAARSLGRSGSHQPYINFCY